MKNFCRCWIVFYALLLSQWGWADPIETYCYTTSETRRPDLAQIMAANTPEVSLMIFQSMLPQASQSHDKSVFVDLLVLIAHHHILLEHSQKALFYLEQAKPFLDAVPESTRQDFDLLSLQWERQFAEH